MGGLPGGCGSIPFPFPLFPFCLPVSAVTVGSGVVVVVVLVVVVVVVLLLPPPLVGALGALTAGALMLPVLKLGDAPLASVSGGSQWHTFRPRTV
jgi:hypothetical protein